MCEELEVILSDDVYFCRNEEDITFPYKDTQNIVIPVEYKYLHTFQDNIVEDLDIPLPRELKHLCSTTKQFITLIKGDADFFISKRCDTALRNSKWYGFIHVVVNVGEVVRTKTGQCVMFQTVHDSLEHLNLMKAGNSYCSELFKCIDINSRSSFRHLLFYSAYESITLMQGETRFWPFYGWSQ